MVLKGTKRSLRTGNTLRNTRSRQTDRHTSSVIVRHVTGARGKLDADEADDSHIPADGVEYSLNKKGRWNLPAVIEQNIHHDQPREAAVALLRRHRVNRQNDCTSVVASIPAAGDPDTSDSILQRKKARRKTYCNGLNVLHNGRGKSKKETRKKQVVSTKKDLAQQKQRLAPETVPDSTEVEPAPAVRYDVFYPVPTTSSLRFHPKFTSHGTSSPHCADIEQRLVVTSNIKPTRGSHQRFKHVDYDDWYEDDDYFDDWLYDEDDYYEEESCMYTENAADNRFDHVGPEAQSYSVLMYSDVVEQAFEVALTYPGDKAATQGARRRKRRNRTRGGRFFYSPEIEEDFDSCLGDSHSETSTVSDTAVSVSPEPSIIKHTHMPSVVVTLSMEATDPQRLAEQFDVRYSEAACSPRKIVIDITDRVQAAFTNLTAFRDVFVPLLDLTTYVILTYMCPAEQKQSPHDICPNDEDTDTNLPISSLGECSTNEAQYDVFRVQLNMNCVAKGLAFHVQGNANFHNVDDVLEQVLNSMTNLTPENLSRHPREASASILRSRLAPDFSVVAEVNGWKASCVSLVDEQPTPRVPVVSPNSPLQTGNDDQDDDASSDSASSQEIQPSDSERSQLVHANAASGEIYCQVCFTEIVPGSLEGPEATALSRCGHWFCDTCWQCHLSVSLQESGSGQLQCPQFRCHVQVDRATLLSLQNVRDVMLQQRRLAEVKVMRMFLSKWCPNPRCGRLVKLATSPAKILAEPTSMSCPCGQRFCFRCHGDPHWPLSCEDLAQYHAALRKGGDMTPRDSVTEITVSGKPCPSCRRFIEKNGGCPHMTCFCGYQFWWCCRKPVTMVHDCPSYARVTDITNTRKVVIRDKRKPPAHDQPEWYEMAVCHRSLQLPRHVRDDYRRADQLRGKLLSLSAKGVDIGLPLWIHETSTEAPAEKPTCPRPGSSRTRKSLSTAQRRTVTKEKSGKQAGTVLKTEIVCLPTAGEHTRQWVKHVTHAMIKLKLELHSVMENTAALLHLLHNGHVSHTRGSVNISKVKDAVESLQFHLSSLDGLLGAEGHRDLCRVLPRFHSLQRYAKDTLTTLACLVNQ